MSALEYLIKKCNKEQMLIISFATTFISGLIAHGVMMFNKMSFGDDVYCLFGYDLTGASYTSGRWASEIMEKIIEILYLGEDYSIQLFNIVLFFCMSAVLTFFICRLLDVEKTISIILISSMITVFPTVTSTIGYVYTIAINEIAYLLVGISVYLIIKQQKHSLYVVAVFCSAFAIGIYQALIPFMLTLLILALMIGLIKEELVGLKNLFCVALRCLLYVIASFVVYAIAEKISLYIHDAELSTYQGICDSFSTGVIEYIKRVPKCYAEFFYPEYRSPGDVYPLVSRGFYYVSVVIMIIALYMEVKRLIQIEKKMEAVALTVLALIFPLG